MSSIRQPDWDHDSAVGHQGELIVKDLRRGFAEGTVETKNDQRARETGNLYVEYECYSRRTRRYEPSALAETNSEVWCILISDDPPIGIFLATATLKELARRAYREGRTVEGGLGGKNPTKGVLVPLSWVVGRDA